MSIHQTFYNAIEDITLELTNQCNLHCQICHIWKEKPHLFLSLPTIKSFLSFFPHLKVIALTGGEATLHPELNSIYRFLYKLFLQNRRINIDLATNAYGEELLCFLKNNQKFLHPLSLSISIDGLEKEHDQQRGTPGAFQTLKKNLLHIQQYSIPITLKFVASPLNYHQLLHVAILAQKLHCEFSFKILECLPSYYHRHSPSSLPLFTDTQRKQLQTLIKKLPGYVSLTKAQSLAIQHHLKFLHHQTLNHIQTCPVPRKALFLTCHGHIYNCLYQPPIGTLKNFPLSLSVPQAQENEHKANHGLCPKCLSYHGFLRDFQN